MWNLWNLWNFHLHVSCFQFNVEFEKDQRSQQAMFFEHRFRRVYLSLFIVSH